MRLAIFNGSPRGKKSNTKLLLENFQKGFEENGGEVISYDYLILEKRIKNQVDNFKNAENIFLAFPLYVDSVPGNVKKFIEAVGAFDGKGKNILFLVQSGFPEGKQSDGAKKYLQLLAKRWNLNLLGVIVKPGVEGIQIMPPSMTKKLFQKMYEFGKQVAKNGKPDDSEIKKIAEPYIFSKSRMLLLRFMKFTGLVNFYWNKKLKEHNAFDKRDNAPYLQ